MKKGFTLIELLAVLVILGLIALIIIPSVTGTLNNSEESAYKKQIHVLETAAEKWGIENVDELPNDSSTLVIDFNTLYTSGEISTYPVINPKTEEELEGCILVTFNNQYQQHEYKYSSDTSKCGN